ncbi:PBP superfamily domain-containing protein, partial [Alkalibacterium subtropicum]
MNKLLKWGTLAGLTLTLAACGNGAEETDGTDETAGFDTSSNIHLVTREVGSGTRSAFAEMVGLYEGENDQISPGATAQQGTNAVNSTVADDTYAIGYTSVGALNESLKPVQIDGVDPTEENILAGDYEIARNFNLIIGDDLDEVAEDFWAYMFSAEGQAIVEEAGYIPADTE